MRSMPVSLHTRRLLGACAVLGALSACGGGSSEPAPVVLAPADSLSLGSGRSASVLTNDTVGGQAARLGAGGNASLSITTSPLPTGVSFSVDGLVSVAAGATPGAYALAYRLCDAGRPDNCATGSVGLTVPLPPIEAAADTLSLSPGNSASVLGNDRLDGLPATSATTTASNNGAWPSGFSLGADGQLSVAAGTPEGTQSLSYRLCQTVAPGNCATAALSIEVAVRASASGRALNASTGAPAAGVTVRANGLSAVTNANGEFTLAGLRPTERLVLQFSGAGFGENVRLGSLGQQGLGNVTARLLPLGTTGSVDAATGGTVGNATQTARVVLPGAGLVLADGSAASGPVTVRLTPINPAQDSSLMPGDYSTLVNGQPVLIESFGALAVELEDAQGRSLNLRGGQTASIRIPLGTRATVPPATVPLFFFDTPSGRWVQEGSASLRGVGSERYYEGTVSHFSVWNADRVADTVWVQGCLADVNGTRVAGGLVSTDGIDYSSASTALTDANGAFRVPMLRGGRATFSAFANGRLSNTLSDGRTADFSLPTCLTLGDSAAGITIKLTWGEQPLDLDAHLIAPDGTEVYFEREGSLSSAPFAALDVDDISSFGPEVITLSRLMVGTYKYAVVNYTGFAGGPIAASNALVDLRLPNRAPLLFNPPPTGESVATDVWTVLEMTVDAQCNVTVRPSAAYATTVPTNPSTPAVYCVKP
jgi:hypothetical protein